MFSMFILVLSSRESYAQSAAPENHDSALAKYRLTIDSLDNALVRIIGEREKIVREIGIYKAKHNVSVLQSNRFQQVLNRSIAAGKEQGLSPEFITRLMNLIHDESLRLENEIKRK